MGTCTMATGDPSLFPLNYEKEAWCGLCSLGDVATVVMAQQKATLGD